MTATIAPATARPATPPPPVPLVGLARYTQLLITPVAVASALLIGFNKPIALGASTALVPGLLLLPVCLSAVAAFRYARVLLVLGFLALAGGAGMALAAPGGHAVNDRAAISQAVMILTAVLGVAVLLWVGRVLGMETVALLYGVGALASAALDPGRWGSNPWKFAFAFPVTVIVLALLDRRRRIIPQVLTLAGLGLASVLLDYRSFFGFCVLTGVVLLWQQIGGWRPPRHKAGSVIVVGGLGLAMYFGGTALLVDGALGPELQERSEAQIEASGSLLLGGRPEWSGTVRLMAEQPWGYGLGVVPDTDDVKAIKSGFAGINVDYNNGYVERFMTGESFKLHSIVADLWAYCGVFGLALCAAIALILVGAFVTRFATRTGTPLFLFMSVLALWDLAFGPSYSNLPDVTLALALALAPPAAALRRRSDRLAARRAFRVESRRVTSTWTPPSRRGNAGDLAALLDPVQPEVRIDPERTQFLRRELIPDVSGPPTDPRGIPPVPVRDLSGDDAFAPDPEPTEVLAPARPTRPDPPAPDPEPTEVLARPWPPAWGAAAPEADRGAGSDATQVLARPPIPGATVLPPPAPETGSDATQVLARPPARQPAGGPGSDPYAEETEVLLHRPAAPVEDPYAPVDPDPTQVLRREPPR